MVKGETNMVDNMSALAVGTDELLSQHLGVDFNWTKFIGDVLRSQGMRGNGAAFEDMVTDVVTNILMAFDRGGKLKDKADWYRQTCTPDTLLAKQKSMIKGAVIWRFRDFKDRPAARMSMQLPDKFEVRSATEWVGGEMDADNLRSMISAELESQRESAAAKWILDCAVQILPDRMEGMSIRDICTKHGIGRGRKVSLALSAIYSAVEAVAKRLNEGWMLTFLK
jgi:hypothetical protein